MLIGVIASMSLIMLETLSIAQIPIVAFLLGVSLGLGVPSCLAFFGDYSVEENRGRLAGIIFFAASLCIFFVGLLLSFATLVVGALILAAWRGIGLLLFLLTELKKDHRRENMKEVSYLSILSDRSFLLYLVPWIMFCLINFLETPVVTNFLGKEFASFIPIAEYGIGGFVALVCGWFADRVGRKRVVIFGFIMLGIGYAVLGLFSNVVLSWYLYILLDGIAWGIFSLMFYLVIWSELAETQMKEKYYLLGVLPFLISGYIQVVFTPYAALINISTAFSLASFFLFLAVYPILLAPETLPERKIELRRLRTYVEKARKVREKSEET
jgi:MFS family permease